jgi:hypothetical protein
MVEVKWMKLLAIGHLLMMVDLCGYPFIEYVVVLLMNGMWHEYETWQGNLGKVENTGWEGW